MGFRSLRVLILVLLLATPSYAFDVVDVLGAQTFFDNVALIKGETGPAGVKGDTGTDGVVGGIDTTTVADTMGVAQDQLDTLFLITDDHSDSIGELRGYAIDTPSVADTISNHTHSDTDNQLEVNRFNDIVDDYNDTFVALLADSFCVSTDTLSTTSTGFVTIFECTTVIADTNDCKVDISVDLSNSGASVTSTFRVLDSSGVKMIEADQTGTDIRTRSGFFIERNTVDTNVYTIQLNTSSGAKEAQVSRIFMHFDLIGD